MCFACLALLVRILRPYRGGSYRQETRMPIAAEKPGKGTYQCKHCGYLVVLEDGECVLPFCPNCNYPEFRQL